MGWARGRGARRVGVAAVVASGLVVGQGGVAGAAPADLDPGFGGGDGIATTDLGGFEEATAMARQPDGKLVVVGRAGDGSPAGDDLLVARYTRRGEADPSFGGGDGVVLTDIAGHDDSADGVALQRDGRIVVAGVASTGETGDAADSTDSVVARYTRDGRLDRSFGDGDGIVVTDLSESGDGATDVAVLPGGDVVTSGTSNEGAGWGLRHRTAVVRYQRDGTLDPTFGTGGVAVFDEIPNGRDVALATRRDGRLLVSDVTGSPDDPYQTHMAAVQLLADGSLDIGFGGGDGIAEAPVPYRDTPAAHDVQVQGDGRVVVAGGLTFRSSPYSELVVARFTPDGAPDTTFGGDGTVETEVDGLYEVSAAAVAVQPDAKLVAVGSAFDGATSAYRQVVVRYDVDGSLDTTFDGDGRLTTTAIGVASPTRDVLVQPDGRIVTAGGARPSPDDDTDVAVVRFLGDPRPPGR